MVLTSDERSALRLSASCLPGLMAIITIAAKIAIMAITNRISSSVKPFDRRENFLIFPSILIFFLITRLTQFMVRGVRQLAERRELLPVEFSDYLEQY